MTLDGELLAYLWAGVSAEDDTAGFIPRHGMGATGLDAGGTSRRRLKRARDKGISPAEAVRQWVGAPEDPRAGGVPTDAVEQILRDSKAVQFLAVEQILPDSKAVQFLASRYSNPD